MFFRIRATLGFFLVICFVLVAACKQEEPECIPSGKTNVVEVEKTPLPGNVIDKVHKDLDHCQACVRSATGFFSCQRAWQKKGETRDQLKERARIIACKDAGHPADNCPQEALFSMLCKGDAPPQKASKLSKEFQKLLLNRGNGKIQEKPATENK